MSNAIRWVFAMFAVSLGMMACALIAFSLKYLIIYYNTGIFNVPFSVLIWLSFKIGVLTGLIITIGIWIKWRFDIK